MTKWALLQLPPPRQPNFSILSLGEYLPCSSLALLLFSQFYFSIMSTKACTDMFTFLFFYLVAAVHPCFSSSLSNTSWLHGQQPNFFTCFSTAFGIRPLSQKPAGQGSVLPLMLVQIDVLWLVSFIALMAGGRRSAWNSVIPTLRT